MTYKVLILLLIIASCNNPQKNNQKVQQKVNNESSVNTKQNQGYNIGDIATDFKLKNVDGKMVSLLDYKNAKGFIIIFTANHCPFSKAYEDRIIALDKKYDPKNFPVIAINPTDPDKIEADS